MARRPSGYLLEEYGQDLAIVNTRTQAVLLILGIVLLFCLPLFAGRVWVSWITITGIYLIAALGLNILSGMAGQASFGQAAFMGVGAYAGAILSLQLHWPFLLCLLCSGFIAAGIGTVISLACFRLKGFYLALVTLAMHYILPFAVANLPKLTGGFSGLRLGIPTIGGVVFDTPTKWFFPVIAITLIMVFWTKNLHRSRIGKAFVAIRDNDRAADAAGINVPLYKMLSFFIGTFFAGIAGYLLVCTYANCIVDYFNLLNTIWLLGMILVGGMGVATGTIFGVVFVRLLQLGIGLAAPVLIATFPSLPLQIGSGLLAIISALAILLFIIFQPRGLSYLWDRFKNWYRLWPFSRAAKLGG